MELYIQHHQIGALEHVRHIDARTRIKTTGVYDRNAYNYALFVEGDKRDSSSARVLSEQMTKRPAHMTSYGE